MRKVGFLASFFFFSSLVYGVAPVAAVDCVRALSGHLTVSSSCTFPNTIDGADAAASATSTTNTANLTVNNNATLTVNSGQTVVWGGSISISGGGSIAINSTGELKQTAIWYTDADNDGYPSDSTAYAQNAQPTNGKRRAYMTGVTVDCSANDVSTWQNLTCYQDADGDGWTVGSPSTACRGASCPAGWRTTSSGTDCHDSYASYNASCPYCLGRANGADCGAMWETGCTYTAPYWWTNVYDPRCDGNVTCYNYCYELRAYWNNCKNSPYTGWYDTC